MTKRNENRKNRRSILRKKSSRISTKRPSSRRSQYRSHKDSGLDTRSKIWWIVGGVLGTFLLILTGWFILRSLYEEQATDIPTVTPQTLEVASSGETISPVSSTTSSEMAVIITTISAEATSPSSPDGVSSPMPNFTDLQQQMYGLINEVRLEQGLSPLAWDTTSAIAGKLHAEDMARTNYFSHWNQAGLGPEHRYAQVGGYHAVMENISAFSNTYDDGSSAPIQDWHEVIQNAQIELMNSPGHRANILDPAHTHVGIGMAYNPDTGQFRIAQEFVNQYVHLIQPISMQATLGDKIVVNGRLSTNNINNVLLDLAYEPFPELMSREELNQTSIYTSRAESISTIIIPVEFDEIVTMDIAGEPGYYHIRVYGELNTIQSLLMDRVIAVR